MPTFRIDFDPRLRAWLLRAHPLLNHADLRFGCESRGGGSVGLIGAINLVIARARRSGGRIEIHHWGQVTMVQFPAEDAPELADLGGSVLAD